MYFVAKTLRVVIRSVLFKHVLNRCFGFKNHKYSAVNTEFFLMGYIFQWTDQPMVWFMKSEFSCKISQHCRKHLTLGKHHMLHYSMPSLGRYPLANWKHFLKIVLYVLCIFQNSRMFLETSESKRVLTLLSSDSIVVLDEHFLYAIRFWAVGKEANRYW